MIQIGKAFDRHAKAPFMVVRISLILAMLGASLFSPAIQAGPGDSPVGSGQIERHPRPLPPGRGNAIQRTVLGDPVVVDDWQIEQVGPSGT